MILTWNHDVSRGRIAKSEYIWLDFIRKPNLSFQFDGLFYEEPTGNCVKLVAGDFITLNGEERDICKAYIDSYDFEQPTKNVCDENGFFIGKIPVSQMEPSYIETSTPPAPGYIWNIERGFWEEMYAINADGQLIVKPNTYHHYEVIFTASDTHMFPEKPFFKYNFETKTWSDPRGLNDARATKIHFAKQYYENQTNVAYGMVGPFERERNAIVYKEAKAYIGTPLAETPMLDIAIDIRNNPDVTKQSFCEEIVATYEAYVKALAENYGKLLFKIDEINTAPTIAAVDAIYMEV